MLLAWRSSVAEEPLRTAGDRPIDIQHIKLELDVALEEKTISVKAVIDFIPLRPAQAVTFNAVGHEVTAVKGGGEGTALAFENTGEELIIRWGSPLTVGQKEQVTIEYKVRDPKAGLYFFGPSEKEPKVPLMVWSQGEPISNRHWFPCLDHPNERQTTEVIATVNDGFEVLSNGNLISSDKVEGGKRRFHWRQGEPHVAYLVTLVVGRFAIGRDDWRGKPVTYYTPPERAADIPRTFGHTREMLDYFSERFGIEYPWEKYAQVVVEQFIMGGMENTSATTLYSRVMHDERAILDNSPDWLIAHELAHEWWGVLLTCKDWAHLWLNEGFATYAEALWAEKKLGTDEFHYVLYQKSGPARSGAAKTRPVVDRHYANPGTMFDSRAYPKGAWVLHMLRCKLGDDLFFACLAEYGKAFRQQTVETGDFRRVLERQTGRSLERFFYDWTERPGNPDLTVATSHDSDAKAVKITIKQTQKEDPFYLPIKIELRIPGEEKPVVVTKEMVERELTFYVPVAAAPDLVRFDPEFSLLADIKEEKSRDLWVKQAKEAPTVVERLRAVEHFGESKQPADRELLASILDKDSFYGVRVAAATALGKSGGDAARDALITGLKGEHPKIRRACAEALGKFAIDETAAKALRDHLKRGDQSYFVEAALVSAYSQAANPPELAVFEEALTKDAHGDVIQQAALRGIALSEDAKALDLLRTWSTPGHPSNCRQTAIGALAKWMQRNAVEPKTQAELVNEIIGYLKESPSIRMAAIGALRELGGAAVPAREVLQSLADQDPEDDVRNLAKAAIEKIQADTPAPVELSRLRTELEKLQKENDTLEERLQKIEGKY
jgi:aminopeptidase N